MEAVLEILAEHAGPWAFLLLVACGLGLPPWSEELVTIAVGHFVSEGHLSMAAALIWCWAGLLAGDSVVFWVGGHLGERVYGWPILRKKLSLKRRARFNRFFLQHGTKAVFASRFVPGLRIIAYFVAGNLNMKYWKFFVLDAVGAAVYAPAGVYLGYVFSGNLEEAMAVLRRFEIPVAIVGVVSIVLVFRYWGRSRKARLEQLLKIRARRRAKKGGKRRPVAGSSEGAAQADPGESVRSGPDGSAGHG